MRNPENLALGGWMPHFSLHSVRDIPYHHREWTEPTITYQQLRDAIDGEPSRAWHPCERIDAQTDYNPHFASAEVSVEISRVAPRPDGHLRRDAPPAFARYILLLRLRTQPDMWTIIGSPLHPLSLTYAMEQNDEHEPIREILRITGIDTRAMRTLPHEPPAVRARGGD